MNHKTKTSVLILLFVIPIIYLLKEGFSVVNNCPWFPDRRPGSDIATYLIRIQEAHWYHEQKFATIDELTTEGLEIAQKNRKYSMEVYEKSVFT